MSTRHCRPSFIFYSWLADGNICHFTKVMSEEFVSIEFILITKIDLFLLVSQAHMNLHLRCKRVWAIFYGTYLKGPSNIWTRIFIPDTFFQFKMRILWYSNPRVYLGWPIHFINRFCHLPFGCYLQNSPINFTVTSVKLSCIFIASLIPSVSENDLLVTNKTFCDVSWIKNSVYCPGKTNFDGVHLSADFYPTLGSQ